MAKEGNNLMILKMLLITVLPVTKWQAHCGYCSAHRAITVYLNSAGYIISVLNTSKPPSALSTFLYSLSSLVAQVSSYCTDILQWKCMLSCSVSNSYIWVVSQDLNWYVCNHNTRMVTILYDAWTLLPHHHWLWNLAVGFSRMWWLPMPSFIFVPC